MKTDAAPVLYPVEDGPGSSRRVEVAVKVLIGTERSTVNVTAGGTAVMHEVRPHGSEVDGIGSAVEVALRRALASYHPRARGRGQAP
jgi:hypothetical protein